MFAHQIYVNMRTDLFASRHIGISEDDLQHMLKTVKAESLDQIIAETIPSDIRLPQPLQLSEAMSENGFLSHIKELSEKNKMFKTYIGLGYHMISQTNIGFEHFVLLGQLLNVW